MENSFYNLAQILVCDPVASNRAATRSALYSLGCRNIEIVADLGDFQEALDCRPPDLAICETQDNEKALCRIVREIRHGEQSYNPFIVVIVTSWTTSAALITDISNAGADDLLLRPFSAGVLDKHIRAHMLNRKPFVITPDYIGPERRSGSAACRTTAASLVPPNSLRIKAETRLDPDAASHRIELELHAARLKLEAEKMRLAKVR